MQPLKLLAGLVLSASCAIPATASEPLFGYVYTTDLTPKGGVEFEQWTTARIGQAQGRYLNLEMRSEIEYGITNDFQISGYLNYSYLNASGNSVQGLTEGLKIPWNHDPRTPISTFRFDSVSVEAVWRVLSPYKDGIGLAFYVEPEIGPREQEFEFRVIVQKNFLDDRLVLAANGWAAIETEDSSNLVDPGSGDSPVKGTNQASVLELDLGASYRFAPNWFAGIEYRNHNEFGNHGFGDQEHSANFIGPNIHYASQKWFATLTFLTQFGTRTFNDEQARQTVNGRVYGDEHTHYDGLRLKLGYVF